ncbi:MAG TPA: DUF4012 domain-containing protein [Acidimicrobiales bacterium]|nr:DUF4012 domain-containing protein [Acidimicrobiales bacterium]
MSDNTETFFEDWEPQDPAPTSFETAPAPDELPPVLTTSLPAAAQEFRPNWRRRILLGALGAYLLALAFVLVSGFEALSNAQAHISATKTELSIANLGADDLPGAEAAADSMHRAHTMFASPVVWPLRLLPVVGRQLRVVDKLSRAGELVVRVGIDARNAAKPVAAESTQDGASRLRVLAATQRIAHDSVQRLSKVDLGPSDHLIRPLADTRAKFAAELNRIGDLLERTDTGTSGLAAFLKGPAHYAVFAANNSEMRAGSGMYLQAATLDVANGEFHLGPMKSIYDLPPAPNDVPLEYDFLRLWGTQAPGSDYRFVNMTPRFPTSAALLQRMWAASGAGPVDGVLVLDPVAVVDLMKVTGDVSTGGHTVSAGNALGLFLHDQYLTFPTETKQNNAVRRDFLDDVVQQVFEQVNSAKTSQQDLGQALGAAASGRHVLAWAADNKVERGWDALGVSGTLPDQSVAFALQNRGGNKLDYFQSIAATARATISRAGSDVTMEFAIRNAAPTNEPAYIVGPQPGSIVDQPGVYVGIASVNLPKAATHVRFSGGDYALVNGPDGNTQVVSQWVRIDPGKTRRLRLSFRLPPGTRSLFVAPSARQPSILWHIGQISWYDTNGRVIHW